MSQTKDKYQAFLETAPKLPRHIAIIMDGNGRWAQQRGQAREQGHAAGAKALDKVMRAAVALGIPYLTVYAFSTENWGRPQGEVEALMSLLVETIREQTPGMQEHGVRLLAIGDLDRLPSISRTALAEAIEKTQHNDKLTLTLALSYSARWELSHCMRRIATEIQQGLYLPEEIDEAVISQRLCTAGLPDPDLLIRTGGEQRISNFLLWQTAYAELYFSPIYWPDFDGDALLEAISDYSGRERRYGLTREQINKPIQQAEDTDLATTHDA
ncbi:isoprenyl transferase [Porphyromonas crevioricanis]|uniref:Isoprenyl transferase n=1 Tax=Porphyromonas crevioricanis TaxID=393921 RepID=A0A2X4PEK8_9PORP|nr:isoprenyl transferase [Porphyromonas crevioricanis]GAD07276.1 undecaprenyl pyrophosphate synthetase [Porphyromonas crevioricanis JCM 13913]SQH72224.1 Undecaprenyl pyrophosphate synthase [Porphyromonas crevioricanis]